VKLADVIDKRNRSHKGMIKINAGRGERMSLGILVITGKRPGPVLYIQAAQHPEFQGCGAIRDLAEEIKPERLRGTLILVPLAGTHNAQMLDKTHMWKDYIQKNRPPAKKTKAKTNASRNMYFLWPGDPKGSTVQQRMVNYLWEGYLKHSDVFVDIHSWSLFGVPAVSVDGKSKRSLELACWTGYPYIYALKPVRYGSWKGFYDPESSQMYMKVPRLGVPGFVIEGTHVSEQGGWIFYENIQMIKRTLRNLMKKMGMLAGRPDYSSRSVLLQREIPVKPKKRGLFIPEGPLGTIFKKGDIVGRIYDIDTFELLEKLKAPRAGCFSSIWPVAVVTPENYAIMLNDDFRVLKPG